MKKVVKSKSRTYGIKTESVAGTGESKISSELQVAERKEEKFRKINSDKIRNKVLHEKAMEKFEKKQKLEKMIVEKNCCVLKPKSKSELESKEVIEFFAGHGETITVEEARMVKSERRLQKKIGSKSQEKQYFRTMNQRIGTRGMHIILTIFVIQGTPAMPKNARAYQVRVVAFALSQSGNVSGFFTVPFPGNALMVTDNGLLDTAIKTFEKGDGSGSAEAVAAAVALVKVSVDLYVRFINTMCIANQAEAEAIIVAAKLKVIKKRTAGTKPDFGVKKGVASGSAILTSKALMIDNKYVNATYNWQYGYMVAGVITWVNVPSTPVSRTTIAGLQLVQTYFRKSITNAAGQQGAWSDPEDLLVK